MEYGSPFATPMPAYYSSIVPTVPPTVHYVEPARFESSMKNVLPAPNVTAAQRATVVVRLPADARLYVDQQLLELTSSERTFVTPELPIGRDYAYTFKIEYERGGRTLSESQKVTVTAGKTSTISFDDLTIGAAVKPANTTANSPISAKSIEPNNPVTAAKPKTDEATNPFRSQSLTSSPMPARISIKLPADTTLYIDGKKNDKSGSIREFTTPPIPFGKEFSYELKLVKTRNGQPEELTQKIVFQAGETVTVDFTDANSERRAGR